MLGLERWEKGEPTTRREDWVLLVASLLALGINVGSASVAIDHEGEFKAPRVFNVLVWASGICVSALLLYFMKVDDAIDVVGFVFRALPPLTVFLASCTVGWNLTVLDICYSTDADATTRLLPARREMHCAATWAELASAVALMACQARLLMSFCPFRFPVRAIAEVSEGSRGMRTQDQSMRSLRSQRSGLN